MHETSIANAQQQVTLWYVWQGREICNHVASNIPNAVAIRYCAVTKPPRPSRPDWLPKSRLTTLSTRHHHESFAICVAALMSIPSLSLYLRIIRVPVNRFTRLHASLEEIPQRIESRSAP